MYWLNKQLKDGHGWDQDPRHCQDVVKILEIKTACQDVVKILEIKTFCHLILFSLRCWRSRHFLSRSWRSRSFLSRFWRLSDAFVLWHCAGFLILWPYTLGLTSSVHRGQPDDAIPIRDPSLTCHELFTNYG